MVAGEGLEPPAFGLWARRATNCSIPRWKKWREKDSNLRRRSQRIYSPSPLATREPLQINKKMAPQTGLEPVTSWLTVMRSTDWAIEEHILAMTYSPTKRIRSTIGAGGLNFCVRNGYRCDPSAIITRIFLLTLFYFLSETISLQFPQNYSMYNFLHFHPSQPWSSPRPISIS